MSTKIFNGYRIETDSLQGLQDFVQDYRKKARPRAVAFAASQIMWNLASKIDDAVMDGEPYEPFIEHGVYAEFCDFESKVSKALGSLQRDVFHDLECNLSLVPDTANGYIYVLIYAEQRFYHNLLEKMPGIEPFPYWDNTDGPDELSEAQWKARGKTWERILDGFKPSADVGFTAQIFRELSLMKTASLRKAAPSFERRVNAKATHVVQTQRYRELTKDLGPFEQNQNEHFGASMQASRWSESDEAAPLRAAESERLKTILPSDALEDALRKYDEIFGQR